MYAIVTSSVVLIRPNIQNKNMDEPIMTPAAEGEVVTPTVGDAAEATEKEAAAPIAEPTEEAAM